MCDMKGIKEVADRYSREDRGLNYLLTYLSKV